MTKTLEPGFHADQPSMTRRTVFSREIDELVREVWGAHYRRFRGERPDVHPRDAADLAFYEVEHFLDGFMRERGLAYRGRRFWRRPDPALLEQLDRALRRKYPDVLRDD